MGKLIKVAVYRRHMSGEQSSMVEYFAVRADDGFSAVKYLKDRFLVTDEKC